MINPSDLCLDDLPSVPLESRAQLPAVPCIYFAIDSKGVVQYVGRSVNPKARWGSHHKLDLLAESEGVRIAYLSLDADLLVAVEPALIAWFDPPLNIRRCGLTEDRVKSGRLKNRVKQFLESRDISAYQFIKDTGIAPATGYKLARKPDYLPSVRVLEAICEKYEVQPGELIYWEPE